MVTHQKTETQSTGINFSEAPASFNVRFTDANGFESMLTIRGQTGMEVLEKSIAATNFLLESGCKPFVNSRIGYRPTEIKPEGENGSNHDGNGNNNPAWCAIHHLEMKRYEKGERNWYSHKTADGWCQGK